MARLIEVQNPPPLLTVDAGDVLLFRATGGRVESGSEAIECLGPFVDAVVGDNGIALAPAGLPNSVLFRTRKTGQALIELKTALHLGGVATVSVRVVVA